MTVRISRKTFNTDLIGLLETECLVDIAQPIMLGALNRQESRGAQSRTDFPERDDEKWMVHTLMHYQGPTTPIRPPDYSRKVVTFHQIRTAGAYVLTMGFTLDIYRFDQAVGRCPAPRPRRVDLPTNIDGPRRARVREGRDRRIDHSGGRAGPRSAVRAR
jgi:hypothetical protein